MFAFYSQNEWFNQKQQVIDNGPLEKVVIGTQDATLSSLLFIAQRKGFFQEYGLDVTFKKYDNGTPAIEALFGGDSIDIVSAPETPIVLQSFKRSDFSILGGIAHSDNDFRIIARRDKGIEVERDLVGKKIGYVKGSGAHYYLSLFLVQNQMTFSDVELVERLASELPRSLTEGDVDAITAWSPQTTLTQALLGNNAIEFDHSGVMRRDLYLIAKNDFIKSRHELITRLFRALDKASEFAKTNRNESIKSVAEIIGWNEDVLAETWDRFNFELFFDQMMLTNFDNEARWAIQNGLYATSEIPNALDYIYPDAMKEVNPMAVEIFGT